MTGKALVVRGDALKLPLPDESVDLAIFSPPYFSLRSYRDGDEHYPGQLGSEPTPQAFLEALWLVMHEVWRCLKPTGSCFVNLGDKRSGSGGHNNASLQAPGNKHAKAARSFMEQGRVIDPGHRNEATWTSANGAVPSSRRSSASGAATSAPSDSPRSSRRNAPDRYNQAAFGRAKSKMLLPHRFAQGCMDGLASPCGCPKMAGTRCPPGMHRADLTCVLHGRCRTPWIMRSDIVWQKLNGLPESVTDRCRDSHEYLFHFVKSPRYFAAVDEIRVVTSDVVAGPQCVPLCALCGRPPNALAPVGVGGSHEGNCSVVPVGVANEVGAENGVKLETPGGPDHDDARSPRCSPIPLFGVDDLAVVEDSEHLVNDERAAVVDGEPKMRAGVVSTVRQAERRLAVDDASKPSEVCFCDCHTPILSGRYDRNEVDQPGAIGVRHTKSNPLGGLPGSVWPLASEPLIISDEVKAHYDLPDHFAAFPSELVRRVILGWSPSGVCTVCNEGRRPVVAKKPMVVRPSERRLAAQANGEASRTAIGGTMESPAEATITGYSCRCGIPAPPTRPAVVLDPFNGSGTTTMVARALGRIGVGTDLSADYCRLAHWRTFRSGGGAKAIRRTNGENQGSLL